jgi:hypothetical protein
VRYPIKSRRGVYYDLTQSPYEYKTSYGEIFKFHSKKKLEIFSRDYPVYLRQVEKAINKLRECTMMDITYNEKIEQEVARVLFISVRGD